MASVPVKAPLLRRHPLVTFFMLAYALTWIPVALVLVATQLGVLPANSPVVSITSRLISFGPAIAALIATAAVSGRAGVGQLLRRLVQWRVGVQWYLFAVFGILLALLIGAMVMFRGAPLAASAGQWQTVVLLFLPTVAVAAITTGLGEETGWRGFALPRLQSRHGALLATLIVGVLWGLWHLQFLATDFAWHDYLPRPHPPNLSRPALRLGQSQDSSLQAPLAGPFPRVGGIAEQVAVRTPLLVDVLAAAHQIVIGPEEHRIAVHRPTSLKPKLHRPALGAGRECRAAGFEGPEDAEDVVGAPGPEASAVELDDMSVFGHAESGRSDHMPGSVAPDPAGAVQLL